MQNKTNAFIRGDVCVATQTASRNDRVVFRGRGFFIVRSQAVMFFEIVVERLRPTGKHDRAAALIRRQIGVEPKALPQLFGDEWQDTDGKGAACERARNP